MSTMCPERLPSAASRGFLIPSAVFLLVILAGLAVFLTTVSSGQHLGSAQDVLGARAYQAARSGLEWGFYRALNKASCQTDQDVPLDATAFTGLSLTVQCTSTTAQEGGAPVTLYTITATACSQPNATAPACPNTKNPGPLYVERQLEALVEK